MLFGLGEVLVAAGLVILLFIIYDLWISNIFARHKQLNLRRELAQEWTEGRDPLGGLAPASTRSPVTEQVRLRLPRATQVVLPPGTGFANLYIPRFGKDYVETIVEGTDQSSLSEGPGHYVGTALPGQLGNFAIAGHRVGQGEPFLNLDELRPDDAIVIQTAHYWYVYTVLSDAPASDLDVPGAQAIPGREIVSPDDGQVIDPVPDNPGITPTRALLTLTTCNPKFSSSQRLVIHAQLFRAVATRGAALPSELSGGTL
jgi:sortase A